MSLVLQADPQAVLALLRGLLQARYGAQAQQWKICGKAVLAYAQPVLFRWR
jgi:hypothetical protein